MAYFVFAAVVHYADYYWPDFVPQWFEMFGFQMFIVGLLILLTLQGWKFEWRLSKKSLVFILAGLGVYFGGLYLIDRVLELYLGETRMTTPDFVWQAILLRVVIAPFAEELFFRDYLLRAFYLQMGRLTRAIFFSSAFFMLAHLSLYPGAFLMALVNSFLFIRLRSVWPCVIFHMISNLSWYFLQVLYPHVFRGLVETELLRVFFQ